jgi:ecotropic viral integration site 5 protein
MPTISATESSETFNNINTNSNNNELVNSNNNNKSDSSLHSIMTTSLDSKNGDNKTTIENTLLPNVDNEEIDVLIKMERANKEMETNMRSAQSILQSNSSITTTNSSPKSTSLSRRQSINSEANSTHNDDSSVSRLDEEISWELWNQIITEWDLWSRKKPGPLKEYIRKGIPIYLRPIAWQYLSGAETTDSKDKFKEYLKKQSACEKIIRRDVDRTYPDHEFFKNRNGQESLFNIMKAYSIHDPEVGYCQGSAFICGLLLIQVFKIVTTFLFKFLLIQFYLKLEYSGRRSVCYLCSNNAIL